MLASLSTHTSAGSSQPGCPGLEQAAPEVVSTLSRRASKRKQLAGEALVAQKFSEGKAQGSRLL